MNLPASASAFMTSSCWRYRSISLHTINIKMKFLSVLSKASRHQLFSQFFSLQALNTSSSIFYSNQSRSSFSLPAKSFFSPSVFDFSFLAEVHEYYFTPHCGCISIDQEIKTWVWRMHLDPTGLQTTETRVMIPPFPPAVADAGCGQVHVNASASSLAITHRHRHFQEKGVFKKRSVLTSHLHTISSWTHLSKHPKNKF